MKLCAKPIKIIIVGAGPSGLILGLLLAKQGITVELLDAGAELDNQPRAAHYASPAAYELARAGVLEDVKKMGFQIKSFAFRKIDTSFLGGVDHTILPPEYPYKMVVLPLHQLGEILYTHIQKQQTAKVKWSHRVVSVGQNEDVSWVDVETPNGIQRLEADYVIGCDGASSTVRRELFGPEYPGETLNAQIIATNVCLPTRARRSRPEIDVSRFIMTLRNMDTGIVTSLSTQPIGTWQLALPMTGCIACHMVISQVSLKKSTSHDSLNATKRSCLETPSLENIR